MIYQIHDNMAECSEQEVARLLPLVSEQRRRQAMSYKHLFGRYCCLKAYVMLMELLQQWSGDDRQNCPEFLYNEHGAPSLAQGPYFSISHCKQGIAVAVSDRPIGIDIEGWRRVDEALVRRTMNSQELAQIHASAEPEKAFIHLWTRKEAYVKMLGTGIISDMHALLDNTDDILWHEQCNTEKGYICSICEK